MLNEVTLSAWGAVYNDLDEKTLVEAAFNDSDIVHEIGTKKEDLTDLLPVCELKLLGPHAKLATLAVERAWQKANLTAKRNLLRGNGERLRLPKAAVVAGSSIGMIEPVIEASRSQSKKLSPYTLSKTRGNSIAAPIAIRYGLGAGDFSVSAASATSGQAIWLAAQLIRSGTANLVVVVCSDILSDFTYKALNAVGATSNSLIKRPMTADRDGMRPVQASVALIMESKEHALSRGHTPMACWLGGAVKNDCYHLIKPEQNFIALKEAFAETLVQANYTASMIEWLSLHATGTRVWDEIEANLVNELFAGHTPHLSAFKRTFGHTLGSSCLLSTAMIAEGLATERLPILPNDIDLGFDLCLPKVPSEKANCAMNWSAGMGGTVTVNLFEKYDAS